MGLRSNLRTAATAVALLCATATVAACGADDANGLETVTYRGPFVTTGGDAPFYYALELGYYEDEGIDLTIVDSKSSGQTVQAVATGDAQFGEADASSIMLGVAQGRSVRAVASTVGRSSFGWFVPEDSGITTPRQLTGRKVAVVSTMQPSLQAALNAAGLSEDEVSPVLADSNALVSTYLGGQVDALYTTNLLAGALHQRPSNMLLQADHGYNLPDYSLIVTPQLLQDDPELVRGFVAATLKGFQAARENPEAAIDALLKHHPELDPDQAAGVLQAVMTFLCASSQEGKPYGWNAATDWETGAEALRKYADMPGDTDPSRFMTNELFEGEAAIDAGTC